MKTLLQQGFLLGITWMLGSQLAFATTPPSTADDGLVIRYVDAKGAPILRANTTLPDVIRLNGTGAEAIITVSATGLTQDITLRVGPGFEVTPATIAAGTEAAKVTVRHTSSTTPMAASSSAAVTSAPTWPSLLKVPHSLSVTSPSPPFPTDH